MLWARINDANNLKGIDIGTISRMVISCVDNYDMVDVISEWSEGAIDFGGRLYE